MGLVVILLNDAPLADRHTEQRLARPADRQETTQAHALQPACQSLYQPAALDRGLAETGADTAVFSTSTSGCEGLMPRFECPRRCLFAIEFSKYRGRYSSIFP